MIYLSAAVATVTVVSAGMLYFIGSIDAIEALILMIIACGMAMPMLVSKELKRDDPAE